jgi:hypothetical protein
MGPAFRALRLALVLLALSAIVLVANRWHAARALDAARARTDALGLGFDQTLLERDLEPDVCAALLAARNLTDAIGERAGARYDAEMAPRDVSLERLDALTREEAYKEGAALQETATRFLALDVPEQPEAELWREFQSGAGDGSEPRIKPWLTRYALVEYLCGAARVSIAAGDSTRAWRWIELAARLCATQRDTNMIGVSALGQFIDWLHAAYMEAVAVAPDDPARDGVRSALRDVDVVFEARAALRRDAALFLHLVGTPEVFGVTHRAHLRLFAHDLRDKASLHTTWADIIEASERPSEADRSAALAAIASRTKLLPRSHALTLVTVPRALSFWEHVGTLESEWNTLLTE